MLFLGALVLGWCFILVLSQNPEILKIIPEEMQKGELVSDLPSEPEFSSIVDTAFTKDSDFRERNLQYSILRMSPHSKYFTVDKESGKITIREPINREIVCSFRLDCFLNFKVLARSETGVFYKLVDYLVEVEDINDNPPEFTQDSFELFIPENSVSGKTFQIPTAFDRDTAIGNGLITYFILSGVPLFGLSTRETKNNSTDLFITLTSTVNRETAPEFKVLIGASDEGRPSLTGTLTVQVQISDVNDNFPVFDKSLYTTEIPEDTDTNYPILKVHASDLDSGLNGELTYAFSAQQPLDHLDLFRIHKDSGEIFLTKSIESKTGETLELIVESSDKGHPPRVSRAKVEVTIKDTINSMPTIYVDTLGEHDGVAEVSEYGQIGQVVAHISVFDPDSGDNGRTSCDLDVKEFELRPVLNEEEGRYMAVVMSKLDREETDLYNVTARCKDHGFPAVMQQSRFAVKILDENDETPRFSQRTYETSISENNTIGVSLQQLTVTDKDIGKNAEIEFEVVGINKQYFKVDESGLMTARVALDREESDRIISVVIARDKGVPPLSSSATVILDILDINDMRPRFTQMIYNMKVEEMEPRGRFVGIVKATDQDINKNQEVYYHLPEMYNKQNIGFVVERDTGVVKTSRTLDREEKSVYKFLVLASDKGNPSLTGTASVVVNIIDINDNTPYFIYPSALNNSISIPHTFDVDRKIVKILAKDIDSGSNAQLFYSVATVNDSSLFAVNSHTGVLTLTKELSRKDVGEYILSLMANDHGVDQKANITSLFVDVYFDNSTLLAASGDNGPAKAIITTVIVCCVVIFIALVVVVTFFCIRRHEKNKRRDGMFPNSDSTGSTAKLQGGYYISPGVRGSSSSFLNKQEDGTYTAYNNAAARMANPYVVMVQQNDGSELPSEIVEISRNGRAHQGLDDTLNTLDLDQTDDGQFSTFRSQEDILSPGLRDDSLPRKSRDRSLSKVSDPDDTSEEATSDSGRGGSDVDVANAAAAKEKARAQAATPVSLKSGISHRLSPLPQDKDRFVTFRGDSPSSFRFDSDTDTLTRHQRPRFSPMPTSSNPRREVTRFEFPSSRLSESDTDNDTNSRSRFPPQPTNIASIHTPIAYSNGETRQPVRVAPLQMFRSLSNNRDSEVESDSSSNPQSSSRRNRVPRLPQYSGIDFSHHAYGGSNRNSIGAFSNFSANSNLDPGVDYSSGYHIPCTNDSDTSSYNSNGIYNDSSKNVVPEPRAVFSNVVSELQESRPVSMADDEFLLPPYPEVGEEEEQPLTVRAGFTGFTPERNAEREALFPRSRFESSA